MSTATGTEGDVFENEHTKVLTLSEARILLEEYVAKCKALDPEYAPNALLVKGMEYAQRFANNRNRGAIAKIRTALAQHGATEREVGLLANLAPQGAEEARILVPSLTEERYSDEDLEGILREIATHAEFE